MCQIIAIKTTKTKLKLILKLKMKTFIKTLQEKGGEEFSFGIIHKRGQKTIKVSSCITSEEFEKIIKKSIPKRLDKVDEVGLLLFSRQIPEMERETTELFQPYEFDNSLVAVHGTIQNDDYISDLYGLDIKIDTDIFNHIDMFNDLIEGTFAGIGFKRIDGKLFFKERENGLGIWKDLITWNNNILGEIRSTTLTDFSSDERRITLQYKKQPSRKNLFVAFSGGMDIAFSTYKALSDNRYDSCVLNYFEWDTKAEIEEKKAIENLLTFYNEEFSDTTFEVNYIKANIFMQEYLKINNQKVSLLTGEVGLNEAETPSAYVPYRNSLFALTLASIAEGKSLKGVDILFGLNLSEGMVYSDNAEVWAESINKVINFGGKNFKVTGNYNFISPYMNRTKTNYIKEFFKEFPEIADELLEMTFSCYYPVDGHPCQECGSCVLKNKAV